MADRDNKGRFLKENQAAARHYKKDLEEMETSAGNLEGIYRKLAERSADMEDATEQTKDNFEEQVDLGKELLKNTKNIFSVDLKGKDLSKQILKAREDKNATQEIFLTGLNEEINKQRKIQDAGNDALKSAAKKRDTAKSFLSVIPGIGDSLGGALDKAGEIYEEGLGESLAGAPKSFSALKGAAKGAGLAIATYIGKNLFESMQSMGAGLMDVLSRPEFIFFGSESRAIADEFGNMNESSMGLGLNMKLMSVFSGVSAQNQAKIMGMMAATSDSSNEVLHAQMKSYKQAGVPFRAIMDDVAGNTEHFAKFAKDGGANIFEAAKKAKELGVNLGDVASISNSLLDFENSIEKQMEAQVLLGRNISLDKARQLAFTGDQAGMMDEIVTQVGGEAEFNKLNVVQRQALADSVGLTVEKMGALVRAEEAGAEAGKANFLSFVGLGALVVGIAAAVIGALTAGVGAKAALKGAAKGMMGGIAVGAIGGAGAAAAGASIPLAKGGIVSGPTSAVVGEAGPEAVVPLPAQGVKMDLKPMVNKMDELIAINRRMIDEIVNLQVG